MQKLNQEQHIQLLQFMSLIQTCKTEEELQKLKEQYYNIPRYDFLEEYISEKKENQSFSSYKTNLIYDMDKYQRDYKFIYGENFPIYRKESIYNNKCDYTVLNLLNEINECDDIEAYQKLLSEKNNFPKVKIEALSSDFTGIYFSTGLPANMIVNSPESNFAARKQLVESGYSPFTIPSVEDVKENGFDWLHEEISYFKETLNPNFIEMESWEERQNEKIDNDIEQIQVNYELSEKGIENSYYAEQNSKSDYLDENGNPHLYSDEENEIDEGISDEELIQIYKQKYPDSLLNISENTRKELENVFSEIDDYLDKGTVPKERRFTLPKTPFYLQELGSDETVISLPVSVIKKAKETHGLSNEEIKNSLLRFYDPVVVFDTDKTKSENKQNSKLILTDEFAENKPIALAINTNPQIQVQENAHRKFIEVQDIRSIHDRTLIAKNGTDLINQWTENGLCRYVDDKKISDWSTVARVYFPIEALQSDKNNILIKSEIVNSQESEKENKLTKEQAAKAVSLVSRQGFSQNNQEEIAIMFNKLKSVNSIAEKNNEPVSVLDFENPILISEAQIFDFDKNITEENKSKINKLPYAVITVPDKDIEEGEEQTFHQEKYYLLDSLPNKDVILNQKQENNKKYLNEDNFEKYIYSEEFISKFGDWEKANRLEKLRNAESIIKDGKITLGNSDITETVESLIYNEDRKGLQSLEKEIGKNILGAYVNQDTGLTINVSNRNVTEISNHHYLFKEHIQSLSYVPEIIDKAILIGEVENEEKQKHPNIEKYLYFGTGIKIDGVDYTCKSVIGIDKNNNCYYDQSLSTIEKGRLADYIFRNEKVGNLSPLITQRETDLEGNNLPYVYYDKRLINICQVPQMPYLEMVNGKWQPKREAVESVRNGTLFVEKQGQKYAMTEFSNENIDKKDFSEPVHNDTSIIDNDISAENSETESQNKLQNHENNNSNYSAPRPRNVQELHRFFINNPYISGTLVPTIAMRNEQSGHFTFIEGYEFARFEDIGKPNLAFFKEDKKNGKLIRLKPDGQTVVLTKPGFIEKIDEETGEKKLVPDENKRKFIKISRDLYEQAIKNSEIIAKRNPKTKQEKDKMIADYREAANLDEKEQRENTASNFWHNYQAGVMTLANNKQEAMAFAKRLVNEMIPAERKKFSRMVRKYEKLRGPDGIHLSYDKRIIDFYDNMGLKITSNSIWRDHVNDKYNTLDEIKQNTEVFDKEGQPLDKTCRMKIGDTIKMSVTVDSVLSNKKIKLPIQEYHLVAHSKDNNSVALISADGKQKIIKNRDDFIKAVQKIEKKQLRKQQRQDRHESISM